MWMVRWFVIVLTMFLLIVFVQKNSDIDPIRLQYLFGWEAEGLNPLLCMLVAFVLGFITCFVISLFNFFNMRSDMSARDKLIKNLKQELNGYRNQSLALNEEAEKTVFLKKSDVNADPSENAESRTPGTNEQE